MILADAPVMTGLESSLLYLLSASGGVLGAYVLLRLANRDPLPRGPSPEAPWRIRDALAVTVGWFFLMDLVGSVARGLGAPVAWAVFAGKVGSLPVVVAVLFVMIRMGRPHGPRFRGAVAGAALWLATLPLVLCVYLGWTALLERFGLAWTEQGVLRMLRESWVSFFLSAVVLTPLAEEVVFRGVLYPALKRWKGKWVAIPVSAAIFSAVHLHLPVAAPLFLLGIALAWTYERTGTLLAPIIFHAAFNGWTFVEQMARSG